jgi:hypothetical protein
MNAPFNSAQSLTLSNLPAEFESLSVPPLLLPGESLERYELMRQAIFADLAPRTAIEWLLAIDVVELSWEIQRYRVLRHKLLDHYRENAVEQTLRHIDLAELPPENGGRCALPDPTERPNLASRPDGSTRNRRPPCDLRIRRKCNQHVGLSAGTRCLLGF